jgi:2,3-bisphosphoglycerate-independent phosphoglycerate mutase
VHTEGLHVGLPDGQMGNSEVGHMNLGAGRIVYQDLTRVDAAIEDGSFFANAELNAACRDVNRQRRHAARDGPAVAGRRAQPRRRTSSRCSTLAASARRERVAVHAFLDGRDTPPQSAEASLRARCRRVRQAGQRAHRQRRRSLLRDGPRQALGSRASWLGRDRRGRRRASRARRVDCALQAAYARGENDEFVAPTVIDGASPMRDGDAVVFMNFRADRARQLSRGLRRSRLRRISRAAPALSRFVCLTEYDAKLPAPLAFATRRPAQHLGEDLAGAGLTQLRIAETEKYAHVTFFFSGGREDLFAARNASWCRARRSRPTTCSRK